LIVETIARAPEQESTQQSMLPVREPLGALLNEMFKKD
jgi:hypothetical protein